MRRHVEEISGGALALMANGHGEWAECVAAATKEIIGHRDRDYQLTVAFLAYQDGLNIARALDPATV